MIQLPGIPMAQGSEKGNLVEHLGTLKSPACKSKTNSEEQESSARGAKQINLGNHRSRDDAGDAGPDGDGERIGGRLQSSVP